MSAGLQQVRGYAPQVSVREQRGLAQGLQQQQVLDERLALARVLQVQRQACPTGLARLRGAQLDLSLRRGLERNRKAALDCGKHVAPIPWRRQYPRAQTRTRGCRSTGLP